MRGAAARREVIGEVADGRLVYADEHEIYISVAHWPIIRTGFET